MPRQRGTSTAAQAQHTSTAHMQSSTAHMHSTHAQHTCKAHKHSPKVQHTSTVHKHSPAPTNQRVTGHARRVDDAPDGLSRIHVVHITTASIDTTDASPDTSQRSTRTLHPDSTREDEYQALPQPPSLPPPPLLAHTLSLLSATTTTKCVVHQHAVSNRDNHLKSTALPLPLSTPESAPAPTSSPPNRRVSTPYRMITSYLPCTRHS